MEFLFFCHILLLFFKFLRIQCETLNISSDYSSDPCLGYNETNNSCITCSYNYYPSISLASFIDVSACMKRITNETYKKTIYISNQLSCASGICNGSLSNPYISIFAAFESEMNKIDAYNYSELSFLLMGTPHFAIRKDLTPSYGLSLRQFFRRMNVKLYIGPYICTNETLANNSNCFSFYSNGSIKTRPTIYLKTSEFFIFVANELIVENIFFDGRDLPLHADGGTSSSAKYNRKSVSCSDSSLLSSYESSYYCGLYNGYIPRKLWNTREWSYGLFNLEGFFEDKSMKKPFMLINNTHFQWIIPMTLDYTWISLIFVSDLQADMIVENVTFHRSEMVFGMFYHNLFSMDRFFKYLNTSEVISNKSFGGSQLLFRKLNITQYNYASIYDDNYYFDSFYISIICVYYFGKDHANFIMENIYVFDCYFYYEPQNSLMYFNSSTNILITHVTYKQTFQMNGIVFLYCSNSSLNNFSVIDYYSRYEILKIANSNLMLYNASFNQIEYPRSSKSYYFMFGITENTNLTIKSCNFAFLSYARMIIIESQWDSESLSIINSTYYLSMFIFVSSKINFNKVNFSFIAAYGSYSYSIIETKLSAKQNEISFMNMSLYYATSRMGYFLINKVSNNLDSFIFEGINISNCSYVYLFFLQEINALKMNKIYYANITTGQFLHALTIFDNISISLMEVEDIISINQLIWISSDSGTVILNNFTINRVDLKYYQFIFINIGIFSINKMIMRNFLVTYTISNEIDFFKITGKFISISDVDLIFFNNSMRSFFNVENSETLIIENCFSTTNEQEYLSLLSLNWNKNYTNDTNLTNNTNNNSNINNNSENETNNNNNNNSSIPNETLENNTNITNNETTTNTTNETNISIDEESINNNNIGSHLIIIFAKYVMNSTLNNITITNLHCYKFAKRLGEENGIITFVSSEDTLFKETKNYLTILKCNLFNVTQCKSGCIGLVNIHNILIKYSIFHNNSAVSSGGTFSILCSSNVIIDSISINNSSSLLGDGGSFDLYSITSILFTNIIINTSKANNAGAFLIDTVRNFYLQNGSFINISNNNEGGVFSIMSSFVNISNSMFLNCFSGYLGGIFNIYEGNLFINNIHVDSAYAVNGAFIYVSIITKLIVNNSVIFNSSSEGDGTNIMINDGQSVIIENCDFILSKSLFGSGNIFIENQNFNEHLIKNITFNYSQISVGSCIYYNSNDNLTIENLNAFHNQGVLLYITSQSTSKIVLKNLNIQKNSVNYNDPIQTQIFFFKYLEIFIKDLFISQILAEEEILLIDTCDFTIINGVFLKIVENSFFYQPIELSIIYADSSNFTIKNVTMDNNFANISLIYIKCENSYIIIENCSFKNGFSLDQSIIIVQTSEISINFSQFLHNIGKNVGVMFCQFSFVSIKNSLFSNNSNIYFAFSPTKPGATEEMLTDLYLDSFNSQEIPYFLAIDSSNFTLVQGISIYSNENAYISIKSSTFSCETSKKIFSQALKLQEISRILLENNSFSRFSADYGGAISIYMSLYTSNEANLSRNLFEFNEAYLGGAFYVYGDYNLSIISNVFLNNQAKLSTMQTGIGAAGYFLCLECENLSFDLITNEFRNNYAENFASTCFSFKKLSNSSMESNIFLNNSDFAQFSMKYSGFPLKIYFFNSSVSGLNTTELSEKLRESSIFIEMPEFSLKKASISSEFSLNFSEKLTLIIASGQTNQYSLILTDYYSQILSFESSSSTKLSSSEKVLIEKGTADAQAGIILLSEAKINIEPSSFFEISAETLVKYSTYLQLPANYLQKSTFTLSFPAFSRECVVGERYNPSDFSCTQCPFGQYSLENPMSLYNSSKSLIKCNACPDNAYCWNGNQISPMAGYWRSTENSSIILECIAKDACLGFVPDEEKPIYAKENQSLYINGRCLEHNHGFFCYICEKGYARLSSKRVCQPCNKNFWVYAKLFVAMGSILLYIYLQVKVTFKANNTNYMGILLKLLMNHLQQISMISLVQLGWTPNIKDYFNYQEYFSFISEEFISIDCFVTDLNFDLIAEKVIFSNIMPILLSIFAFLLWVFSWTLQFFSKTRISLRHYLLNRSKVTMLIVTYLMFPEILRKCFSLMNCIEIDNSTKKQVLLLSPDVFCWGKEHTDFLLIGSLPGLVIWGLFTPLFLMFLLFRFRNKIQENIRIMQKRFSVISRKTPGSIEKIAAKKSKRDKNLQKSTKNKENPQKIGKINKKSIVIETFEKLEIIEKTKKFQKNENSISIDKIERVQRTEKTEFIERIEKTTVKSNKSRANFERNTENDNFLTNNLGKNFDFTSKSKNELFSSPSKEKVKENTFVFPQKSLETAKTSNKRRPELKRMTSNLETLQNMEMELQKEFGYLLKFLYRGYSPQYYYWEIVLYTKKFLLIFIGSFSEFFPNTTKATILLIVLTYYLFLQARKKPYETYFLNNIEYFSLIVTFLTANAGIMLFTQDLHPYSQVFLIMIITINFSFFAFWGYYFYHFVIKLSKKNSKMSKIVKFCMLIKRILKMSLGCVIVFIKSFKNACWLCLKRIFRIKIKTKLRGCVSFCHKKLIEKCMKRKKNSNE